MAPSQGNEKYGSIYLLSWRQKKALKGKTVFSVSLPGISYISIYYILHAKFCLELVCIIFALVLG